MNKAEKFLLVMLIYYIVTCRATEAEIPRAVWWFFAIAAAAAFILWP